MMGATGGHLSPPLVWRLKSCVYTALPLFHSEEGKGGDQHKPRGRGINIFHLYPLPLSLRVREGYPTRSPSVNVYCFLPTSLSLSSLSFSLLFSLLSPPSSLSLSFSLLSLLSLSSLSPLSLSPLSPLSSLSSLSL